FGWASKERKTQRFISSGGLPKNEIPKIRLWASEDQKKDN
ncbi:unnamed protein product, partial [Rhizophagus irregularis]